MKSNVSIIRYLMAQKKNFCISYRCSDWYVGCIKLGGVSIACLRDNMVGGGAKILSRFVIYYIRTNFIRTVVLSLLLVG